VSYLQELITARKGRLLRLNDPPRVPDRRPPIRIIEIVNGRQKRPEPPPAPPRPRSPPLPRVFVPVRKELAHLPTVNEIVAVVSMATQIAVADLKGHERARPIVLARHMAMHLAARLSGRSLLELARQFGGFDHSSVLHARDRIERLRARDPEVDELLKTMEDAARERARIRNGGVK
jgi:hypothetical protein